MNALDTLGMACLVLAAACVLAVVFHIIERIVALFEGRGIFDRARRRRP